MTDNDVLYPVSSFATEKYIYFVPTTQTAQEEHLEHQVAFGIDEFASNDGHHTQSQVLNSLHSVTGSRGLETSDLLYSERVMSGFMLHPILFICIKYV